VKPKDRLEEIEGKVSKAKYDESEGDYLALARQLEFSDIDYLINRVKRLTEALELIAIADDQFTVSLCAEKALGEE